MGGEGLTASYQFVWQHLKQGIMNELVKYRIPHTDLLYDLGHKGRSFDDFKIDADFFEGQEEIALDAFFDSQASKIEDYVVNRSKEWEQIGIDKLLKLASNDPDKDSKSYVAMSELLINEYQKKEISGSQKISLPPSDILSKLFMFAELTAQLRFTASAHREYKLSEKINFKKFDEV